MCPKDKTPTLPAKVLRGEIYYFNFDPVLGSEQSGMRPAAVLQNDAGNRNSPTVIVAPITSRDKPPLPTHVALPHIGGLNDDSVLLLEQIRTVDRQRMGRYVGVIGAWTMGRVDTAIKRSLGIKAEKKGKQTDSARRGRSRGRLNKASSAKKPGSHVITLCHICMDEYLDAGYDLTSRSKHDSLKTICDKCNYRTGFDYEVVER